jgi:hypothetical protein
MKNAPAIITFATLAVLLLLAVAASIFDSIPFVFIASYVVGFGCSVGFLTMFIADYAQRTPRLIVLEVSRADRARERQAARRAASIESMLDQDPSGQFSDPITMNFLSTAGLRKGPSTLSLI